MAQSHTCLIAITTPRSSEHFFSALLKLIDPSTGKPIFNVLRIGNPCDPCKNSDKPWLCTHKTDELPPWKSFRKQNKYSRVYEGGHEEDNIREQWGMEADSFTRAFNKHIVDKFKELPPVPPPDVPPPWIAIASDPAGAGESGFSITGAYWKNNSMVVCFFFQYFYFFLLSLLSSYVFAFCDYYFYLFFIYFFCVCLDISFFSLGFDFFIIPHGLFIPRRICLAEKFHLS